MLLQKPEPNPNPLAEIGFCIDMADRILTRYEHVVDTNKICREWVDKGGVIRTFACTALKDGDLIASPSVEFNVYRSVPMEVYRDIRTAIDFTVTEYLSGPLNNLDIKMGKLIRIAERQIVALQSELPEGTKMKYEIDIRGRQITFWFQVVSARTQFTCAPTHNFNPRYQSDEEMGKRLAHTMQDTVSIHNKRLQDPKWFPFQPFPIYDQVSF